MFIFMKTSWAEVNTNNVAVIIDLLEEPVSKAPLQIVL